MKRIVLTQFFVLLGGTLFAWFNFSMELIAWLNSRSCALGCSQTSNPFLTPCFWGAVFFTAAFVLNIVILKKTK